MEGSGISHGIMRTLAIVVSISPHVLNLETVVVHFKLSKVGFHGKWEVNVLYDDGRLTFTFWRYPSSSLDLSVPNIFHIIICSAIQMGGNMRPPDSFKT